MNSILLELGETILIFVGITLIIGIGYTIYVIHDTHDKVCRMLEIMILDYMDECGDKGEEK